MPKTILITGGAGFIGYHLSKKMLNEGNYVVAIDNLNDYYDPELKKRRIRELSQYEKFKFLKVDIVDKDAVDTVFEDNEFDSVCHLAAQSGVRHSLLDPYIYINTNCLGFLNILETMRWKGVKKLVYASSSSVYGLSNELPYKESLKTDKPISIYAATKLSGELLAYSYYELFGIKSVGLRFFNVYGPWGRPDSALYLFTRSILEGKTIQVNNYGKMYRDFTYIDDIVNGISLAIEHIDELGAEIINLGSSHPVHLMDFISAIENALGTVAKKEMRPMQLGDIERSHADITKAKALLGYEPLGDYVKDVKKTVEWIKAYYYNV